MRIGQALDSAKSLIDAAEARLLLSHVLSCDKTFVIAHPEEPLAAPTLAAFEALVARRRQGEPLAYLTGRQDFYGLTLGVNPDVLIPRPDTETLVEAAIEYAGKSPVRVLDLCTGSGAVALAIASACARCSVFASDISEQAVRMAQRNARNLRLDVQVRSGDLFGPWADMKFEAVTANPPYVAEGDPHLPALRFEPESALVGGKTGLEVIERIVREAPAFLVQGGLLAIEHGFDQASEVSRFFKLGPFGKVRTLRDLGGNDRVTCGLRL